LKRKSDEEKDIVDQGVVAESIPRMRVPPSRLAIRTTQLTKIRQKSRL
jgi:hypothetical protein